jgi:hypothetical protein
MLSTAYGVIPGSSILAHRDAMIQSKRPTARCHST